jgi:hypothetical protein
MVEGYESERDEAARQRGEAARAEAEALATLKRARHDARAAVAHAASRLPNGAPDCMIEVLKTDWWSGKPRVRRRVPGWYVGAVHAGWTSYDRQPTYIHFALGRDGTIYPGQGVGNRREFVSAPLYREADPLAYLWTPGQLRQFEQLLTHAGSGHHHRLGPADTIDDVPWERPSLPPKPSWRRHLGWKVGAGTLAIVFGVLNFGWYVIIVAGVLILLWYFFWAP